MANAKYVRPKKYSFFSQGNSFDFNPEKIVNFDGESMTMLELHLREARHRKSKDVFVLDNHGVVVKL